MEILEKNPETETRGQGKVVKYQEQHKRVMWASRRVVRMMEKGEGMERKIYGVRNDKVFWRRVGGRGVGEI